MSETIHKIKPRKETIAMIRKTYWYSDEEVNVSMAAPLSDVPIVRSYPDLYGHSVNTAPKLLAIRTLYPQYRPASRWGVDGDTTSPWILFFSES